MPHEVIGRETERAAGEQFLDSLPSGPACLLLEGEAGVGKTTVWQAVAAAASSRGYRVCSCRPAASEATLSFGALSDLLEGVGGDALPLLPVPQRRALEAALLLIEPNGYTADWRAVGTGLRGILEFLALDGPVVVAVDDVQWIDRPSARALEFAARRVSDRPIGFLLAARTPDQASVPFALDRALPEGPLQRLTLGPLSAGALYQVIRSRLGAHLSRPTLLRIEEASGGNPFYALEIARTLLGTERRLGPGEPLPLPPLLTALVAERIRTLSPATRKTLLVAAAHRAPTVALVTAASGRARAPLALARARDAGVIEIAAGQVRFTHPLLASAVYADGTESQRRLVHRRLAQSLRDPEERARHLALAATRRDRRVADALAVAAERAASRGAPHAAAELYELASAMTPVRMVAEKVARRMKAAELYATAGDLTRAREILEEELQDAASHGALRAEVQLRLAALRSDDLTGMTRLCEHALQEAGSDPELQARIQEQLATAWHLRGHTETALSHARRGLELAEKADEPHLCIRLVTKVAWHEAWGRTQTPGLLERGVALEEALDAHLPFYRSPRALDAVRLTHLGRMDEARTYLLRAYAQAQERGDEQSRLDALFYLADLEHYAGNWHSAVEHADAGLELEEQLGAGWSGLITLRALLAASLGDVDNARRLAEEGVIRSRAAGEEHWELHNLAVPGFVALSLGDVARAVEILLPLPQREIARHEPGVSGFWGDAIEALIAVGDLGQARTLLTLYSQAATHTSTIVVRGKAARCSALLAAASGNLPAAFAEFEEALACHEEASQPFQQARTLLAFGTTRRRAKQKRAAREALGEALEIFERLPAPLWAEKARAELARVGLRPSAPDELTETERRVAELAASGLRNREIAAQAFLTPKSVEDVLSRVYRKLGIHSRAELGARMGDRARS